MNRLILCAIVLALHSFTAYSQQIIKPKWGGHYVGGNAWYIGNGSFIVTSANYGTSIWDSESKETVYNNGYKYKSDLLALSDSIVLIMPGYTTNEPFEARNLYTGKTLYSTHRDTRALAVDKKNNRFAIFWDDSIEIRNTLNGQIVNKIHFSSYGNVRYFNDSGTLLLVGRQYGYSVLDVTKDSVIFSIGLNGYSTTEEDARLHNSNNTLAIFNHNEKKVEIWNPISVKKTHTINTGQVRLFNYGFPSKDNFICVANNSILQMWDIQTGKIVSSYQNNFDRIKGVDFNADSSLVLVYSVNKACVLNAKDLSLVCEIPHVNTVWGEAFPRKVSIHPYKEEVLITYDNEVYVYNWKEEKVHHVFRGFHYSALVHYNDKKSEILMSGNSYYTSWKGSDGSFIDTIQVFYRIGSNLFWYPPHKQYRFYADPTSDTQTTYHLYKIPEHREICAFTTPQTMSTFSYRYIISDNMLRMAGNINDSCITIFDTTGTLISRICESPFTAYLLEPYQFSESSDTIYTVHNTEVTKMWDVKKGTLIRVFKGIMPLKGYLNVSRRRLTTISRNSGIDIWDFLSGALIRSFYQGRQIKDVRFNPKRNEVVVLDQEQGFGAFNPTTGDTLYSFPKGSVKDFLFNSQGSLLFTWGGEDNIIHVRDASTGTSIAQLVGHNKVDTIVVDEKNGLLISNGASVLHGWDIATILPTNVETDNQNSKQEIPIRLHYADGALHITLIGSPSEREIPFFLYTITGECVLKDYIGSHIQTATVPLPSVGSGVYYFTTEMFGNKTTQLINIFH